MDTDSFIIHVKTVHIYKYIAKDVETRFDTSNFKIDRPLRKGKNRKAIQMFFKIGAHRNLPIFTGKHLCWSLQAV